MTIRPFHLAAASLLLLPTVAGCKEAEPAVGAASPTAKPALELSSPNTPEEVLAALPTRYGKLRLQQQSGVLLGWPLTPDWLKGHRVQPQTCGPLLINGGQTDETFADWPPFPQAIAAEDLDSRQFAVTIYSLRAPYGERYLDLLDQPAPQCTRFLIDGSSASIVERPIPGLGTRSRYVVRTYPYQGRVLRRAAVLFSTATYAVHIVARSGTYTEPTLIAFGHHVQTLATQKLR